MRTTVAKIVHVIVGPRPLPKLSVLFVRLEIEGIVHDLEFASVGLDEEMLAGIVEVSGAGSLSDVAGRTVRVRLAGSDVVGIGHESKDEWFFSGRETA